jgi:DNA-binding MarR family transcriptional regulator
MVEKLDRVAPWALFLRAHATLLPKLERAVLAGGLPIYWYDVLLVLNAAPDRRLRMSELGREAVVSRERVSRVVTELEREGLVERTPDPDDKRSVFAHITDIGRKRLRAAAPGYLQAIEQHFTSHLSDAEIKILTKVFARLLEADS